MPLFAFLNELSYARPAPSHDVDGRLRNFVATLHGLRRARPDIVLVSEVGISQVEVAPGHTIGRWGAAGENRDLYRRIRGLQNRSPVRSVVAEEQLVEYRFEGEPASGLGHAYSLDGICVSIPAPARWSTAEIKLRRVTVDDAGDIVESDVVARHASTVAHVAVHAHWFTTVSPKRFVHGRDLWTARSTVFPQLSFLDRVSGDLEQLPMSWLEPVRRRLEELDRLVAEWPTGEPAPAWASKVTPESASRMSLASFIDQDGVPRIFHWHARFTPGPGRIHFRIDATRRTLVIGYVGRKLGV